MNNMTKEEFIKALEIMNELNKLKKMSREDLAKALEMMKKLRKEETYSGLLPYHFAMCYTISPMLRFPIKYYKWDIVPGSYKCACCGKVFGTGDEIVINEDFFYRNIKPMDKPSEEIIMINIFDFNSLLSLYSELKEPNYDVELKFNCLHCIANKRLPICEFNLCLPGQTEYTISYPKLYLDLTPQTNKTYYSINKYRLALSFLKSIPINDKNAVTNAIKTWLNGVRNSTSYEGFRWEDVLMPLVNILGLPMEVISE